MSQEFKDDSEIKATMLANYGPSGKIAKVIKDTESIHSMLLNILIHHEVKIKELRELIRKKDEALVSAYDLFLVNLEPGVKIPLEVKNALKLKEGK